LEGLRLYAVRWWKEPEHFLIGHAETFDNYYQLRHLKEDTLFKVQVLAVGTETQQSVPSHELLIGTPPICRKTGSRCRRTGSVSAAAI